MHTTDVVIMGAVQRIHRMEQFFVISMQRSTPEKKAIKPVPIVDAGDMLQRTAVIALNIPAAIANVPAR